MGTGRADEASRRAELCRKKRKNRSAACCHVGPVGLGGQRDAVEIDSNPAVRGWLERWHVPVLRMQQAPGVVGSLRADEPAAHDHDMPTRLQLLEQAAEIIKAF